MTASFSYGRAFHVTMSAETLNARTARGPMTPGRALEPTGTPAADSAVLAADELRVVELGNGVVASNPSLSGLPSLEAEVVTGDVRVTGFVTQGEQSLLSAGGRATEGTDPEIVWVFSEPVTQVAVIARLYLSPAAWAEVRVANAVDSVATAGSEWTTEMALPESGCWQVLITAVPAGGGDPIFARVSILVGSTASGMATPGATPEG